MDMAIEKTVEWAKVFVNEGNVTECVDRQIREFFPGSKSCLILKLEENFIDAITKSKLAMSTSLQK